MSEVLNIFLYLILFVVLFSFPFQANFLNTFFNFRNNTLNYFDACSINVVFFIFFSLFFSFINIDLKILFKIHIVLAICFFIYNNRKFKLDNYISINFLIFCLLTISIFFFIGQNLKLEWDGVNHWLEKVLVFYNGNEIQELSKVKIHSYYPHLGSYIWAYFWKNSIIEYEYFGRLFQVYFYILSIFCCINILNLKKQIYKIFFLFLIILITFDPYLFAGYQEYLIFSSLLLSSRFITLVNFKNPNTKLIFLISLILYSICWFKDEGLVYFIIFNFFLIIFLKINYEIKFIFFLKILTLIVLQYCLQKYIIGVYDFPEKIDISIVIEEIMNYKILITKTYYIILHMIIAFVKYPLWLLILACFAGLIVVVKNFSRIYNYYGYCLLINLLFVFSIFFTFRNFDMMLKVSLDRILFQTSGFFIVLIIFFINQKIILRKINF